jgi:hypothetical protein
MRATAAWESSSRSAKCDSHAIAVSKNKDRYVEPGLTSLYPSFNALLPLRRQATREMSALFPGWSIRRARWSGIQQATQGVTGERRRALRMVGEELPRYGEAVDSESPSRKFIRSG